MPTVSEAITVTFTRDEWLPVIRDGRDYLLHYTYVPSQLIGAPEEAAETKGGRVLVGISRTLMSIWRIEGEELRKILFEYGKRHVRAKAAEGSLGGQSELQLTTANAPNRRPYDPNRIALQFGAPIQFPFPKENPIAAAEVASLPSQIIDLRDSINAIFGEKFGGRLLALPQERHIVELFKECRDHEDFAYRVASIGGLATAISPADLKRHIPKDPRAETKTRNAAKEKPSEQKPLDLLGAFLRANIPTKKVDPIMDALKNFNNLRRMYPVHTDRAEGVLPAHRFFGLDYPVRDHTAAGRRLLEAYRDILDKMLGLLKMERP